MEVESHAEDSDWNSDDENKTPTLSQRGRKNIRNIKDIDELNVDTRLANQIEQERIDRIESIQKKFQDALSGKSDENELILDYDFENNVPLVSVHKSLVMKLKPHQREGVKFMWNSCYESLERAKNSEGSGCILAHCMGLGKTFQVVAFIHTLLNHKEIGTRTILICCPKNTVLNWKSELGTWITPDLKTIDLYDPTRFDNHADRLNEIRLWYSNGGVCLINYDIFRILLEDDDKDTKKFPLKQKTKFNEYLRNPGPDLVICDEGHVLKNEETKLSKVMSRIRTMRRIVLTGTPMQNNLKEFHCMVQFVKPNLLGTRSEFLNMFVNPILNGQYENSLEADVQLMKERSHVLHKKLSGCVQRFDLTTLKKYLPEKHEYVISVPLTSSQVNMYRYYLDKYSAKGATDWKSRSVALFADHQFLQRIWTHPYSLKSYGDKSPKALIYGKKRKPKRRKKKSRDEEDDDEDELSDSDSVYQRKCPPSWWIRFVSRDDVEDARASNKLIVLLKILKACEDANEKILVFSGSLYSLETIEHFLKRINRSEFEEPSLCDMTSSWEVEQDYLVLTGDTSTEDRDRYCKMFNNVRDTRLRLFLISTKAGGIGINLTAANRAVIFDVSWNPTHDIQSIFRIYRLGQTKPCFIYRLVASGTMEEKIYERQVAKQSISYRVVDEKQIARHYTEKELLELYQFEPHKKSDIRVEPKDPFIQAILREEPGTINGIHEHDSLLEHKEDEELQEIEKKDAWTAYNNDNLETLPKPIKTMLKRLKPDDFDPECLRKVLIRKCTQASDEQIEKMMEELIPKMQEILKSPKFINVMTQEAVQLHKKYPEMFKSIKNKGKKRSTVPKQRPDWNDCTWEEDVDLGTPSTVDYYDSSSDSDDSLFLYTVQTKSSQKSQRKSSRKKPLNVWGRRNGKKFGTPDID